MREPADGEVLGKGCEEAEEEVEGVLEEDWELGDRGGDGHSRGERFDVGPCEVDIEEKKEDAKSGY